MSMKYVENPYARAAIRPTHGDSPKSSIATHMAVIAKNRNEAGVSTILTTLPMVPLTACAGYFTFIRNAGMPPNMRPVHCASSPVASRLSSMSLHMPSYCSTSCCTSVWPLNCGAKYNAAMRKKSAMAAAAPAAFLYDRVSIFINGMLIGPKLRKTFLLRCPIAKFYYICTTNNMC